MRNVIRVVEFAKKSRPYKINFSQNNTYFLHFLRLYLLYATLG